MRAVAAVTALLAFSLLLAGCTAPAPSSGALRVGEREHGQTVTLRPGQALEVALPANPSTGYAWTVERVDRAHLAPQGGPTTERDPGCAQGMVGCAEVQSFRFHPVAAGTTALGLRYARSWAPAEEPRFFNVTVVVH